MQSITRAQAKGQECLDGPNWNIASGIEPLVSTAAVEWTDAIPSAIITTTHRNHTVAFVGTHHGELIKVSSEKHS